MNTLIRGEHMYGTLYQQESTSLDVIPKLIIELRRSLVCGSSFYSTIFHIHVPNADVTFSIYIHINFPAKLFAVFCLKM